MYGHFYFIHVDIPNRMQLSVRCIHGNGRTWNLGGNGCRLAVQSGLFRNKIFPGKLAETGICIKMKNVFRYESIVNTEMLFYNKNLFRRT